MTQLTIVNLKCVNCGGVLEISVDMDRFACGYCGSEQIVERRGGAIGLKLVDAVARIQVGTDKTAAELALVRLDKELPIARAHWQEAERNFAFHNKSESAFAHPTVIVSKCIFSLSIIFFIGFGIAVANGGLLFGSMFLFLCVVFAVGAVFLFLGARAMNETARVRFEDRRSKFLAPYGKQIETLETQFRKARQTVDS